jgi:DnaJ-class molecular chaperone
MSPDAFGVFKALVKAKADFVARTGLVECPWCSGHGVVGGDDDDCDWCWGKGLLEASIAEDCATVMEELYQNGPTL